jgi:hypothetical protein
MSIRLIPICITGISWFGKKTVQIVLGVGRPGGMRHREEAEGRRGDPGVAGALRFLGHC